MGFELLSRKPKQRKQEIGCVVFVVALFACCGGAIGVSVHRAGSELKPVCDIAVVGARFDRVRFEAEARKRGVFSTYMTAEDKGGRDVDVAWAERRTLLYPKLCIVAVKDGVVKKVTFETYSPR